MALLSGGAFVHAPYYLADAFSIIPNNYIYIYIYIMYIIYIYIYNVYIIYIYIYIYIYTYECAYGQVG